MVRSLSTMRLVLQCVLLILQWFRGESFLAGINSPTRVTRLFSAPSGANDRYQRRLDQIRSVKERAQAGSNYYSSNNQANSLPLGADAKISERLRQIRYNRARSVRQVHNGYYSTGPEGETDELSERLEQIRLNRAASRTYAETYSNSLNEGVSADSNLVYGQGGFY